MALIDIVRNGVKIISKVTQSLKEDVTLTPWIGQDGKGNDLYGTPVTLEALVDKTKRIRYTNSGAMVMTFATITFVDPIDETTPNPGQNRQQPIDTRDVITLADGGTAPIVQAGGFDDAVTTAPFAMEVVLGHAVHI